MFKVLIVDDEKPARDKLLRFLQQVPQAMQTYACANALDALKELEQNHFDLMFLDIQMPGMTGLELVQRLATQNCPPIVFVTAFDEYALQAFEVHALDYLLKPYDFERFNEALAHVLHLIGSKNYPIDSVRLLMQELQQQQISYKIQLWVQKGKKTIPLAVQDIEYLAADGNYVQIHTSNDKYLIRRSLLELEQELDPAQFARIHRSYLINLQAIQEIFPKSHGDLFVVMRSGTKLTLSRRYKDKVLT